MPRHEVLLSGCDEIAEGTMAFRFSRSPAFAFRAGQSISVALIDPPAEPNSARRTFSLASAPFEQELLVATRMREGSAFKRALKALQPGAPLRINGPLGDMTLHEDAARPAVFIAGGIGITPFRSMLLQAEHDRLPQPLFLAYSNRHRGQAAFIGELEALAQRNPRFRLFARMTDSEGFMTKEALEEFIGKAANPVFYLAGPPAMVEAMNAILGRMGVGADDVKSEEFYGY